MAQHTVYWIENCPMADECSAAAWGKWKNCRSYQGPSHCRSLLKQHLATSGLHNPNKSRTFSEDQLLDIVNGVEVFVHKEDEHGGAAAAAPSAPAPKKRALEHPQVEQTVARIKENPSDDILVSRAALRHILDSVERALSSGQHMLLVGCCGTALLSCGFPLPTCVAI